jgi:Rrf2 family iron-sulfur cluster assembly transcriptional regulator
MFSKACEYAIKSMIFIQSNSDSSEPIRLGDIAEAIDSPVAFTSKILQQLKKSGLLISSAGNKGGFKIPENKTITLKQIVLTIDGDGLFNKCLLGLKVCSSENPCPAHSSYQVIRDYLITNLLDAKLDDFTKKIKSKSISLK